MKNTLSHIWLTYAVSVELSCLIPEKHLKIESSKTGARIASFSVDFLVYMYPHMYMSAYKIHKEIDRYIYIYTYIYIYMYGMLGPRQKSQATEVPRAVAKKLRKVVSRMCPGLYYGGAKNHIGHRA